jgi:hypothetical protein
MTFRPRIKDPNTIMRIGLASLVAASVLRYLAHATAHVPRTLVDAASGAAYGVAIGALLLAARANARRRTGSGSTPCASR